jgi:hypothetical protein
MDQLTERALQVATLRGAAHADVRTVGRLDVRGAPGGSVVPDLRIGSRNSTGGMEH